MPKKLYFERNLKNVNITEKDYNKVTKMKWHKEPFYSTFGRVVNMVTQEDLDKNEELEIIRESMHKWKQRALNAENKLEIQMRLV